MPEIQDLTLWWGTADAEIDLSDRSVISSNIQDLTLWWGAVDAEIDLSDSSVTSSNSKNSKI